MLCDHLTDASLSLWILIGPLVNRLYNLRSLRRLIICRRTFVHSSTAYISALVELRAVIVWRLEHQWTGPPSQMTNPDIDLDLNRSSCSWWCGLGVDASWGSLVPVTRAAFEAVQCFEEEKVCFWRSYRATSGWCADIFLIVGEKALAEGLDEIATFGDALHLSADSK